MKNEKQTITRRDFMRGAATAALCAAVGYPIEAEAQGGRRSRVVLIRDQAVLDSRGRIRPDVLGRMLDEAVAKALGQSRAVDAWKQVVKPGDFVGIKSNVWARLPTPRELEQLITNRLVSAGVPADRIFCDDRGSRAQFEQSTAIINVRPLRTHHWSGIGGCIKNPISLSRDPESYHPDSCADLAKVWELPIIKGKVRLNILDMLTPQFYGRGAHSFDPRFLWEYKGLAVSLDPVAVDAVGAHLLKTKRILHFGEDRPITPTKHIAVADEKHGLGVSDLRRIDLIKLGWDEDILI